MQFILTEDEYQNLIPKQVIVEWQKLVDKKDKDIENAYIAIDRLNKGIQKLIDNKLVTREQWIEIFKQVTEI
jgi:hypothetical protein